MPSINVAAVMRAGAYSPNHIGIDATILNAVADQLRKRGCKVHIYTEEEFTSKPIDEPVIINMCRERNSISRLQRLEDEGRVVINSGYGIENCIRERQALILCGSGIPYPESFVVDTNKAIATRLHEAGFTRCWIKRADFHAQHAEDVSYVRTPEEAQEVLQEFCFRGFSRAVISRHLPGTIIKFYGVADTPFFYWLRPYDVNDIPNLENPADASIDTRLRDICARCANELNLIVYGGECIQDADGSLRIIGINDWPSFGPCRDAAAKSISKAVLAASKKAGIS